MNKKKFQINWVVRLQNKVLVITLLTALANMVFALIRSFGFEVGSEVEENVATVIQTVAGFLQIAIGFWIDGTTPNLSDSDLAMSKNKPSEADVVIVNPEDEANDNFGGSFNRENSTFSTSGNINEYANGSVEEVDPSQPQPNETHEIPNVYDPENAVG